jgi:WD40 repeat protein
MNQEFIAIIKKLIAEQGKQTLADPAKCKAFLADYTRGEYKKESRLLLQALEAGVQKAIEAADDISICKKQQIRVLREDFFLAEEVAADIVDLLILVLNGQEKKKNICKNCKKGLQEEWEICSFCVIKESSVSESDKQTPSQTTIGTFRQNTKNVIHILKKKKTKRNIVIALIATGMFFYFFPIGLYEYSQIRPSTARRTLDGREMRLTSRGDTITLDVTNGRAYRTFEHSPLFTSFRVVSSVTFSPTGRRILSGYSDGSIRLWDVTNGRVIRTFWHSTRFDARRVTSVAFSPTGRLMFSVCDAGITKLWDVASGREIASGRIPLRGIGVIVRYGRVIRLS